jgi:2-succinyl-5-enolpyruvyl-6-hydroxy-3-cyclohexene-1-carboxylate synthase
LRLVQQAVAATRAPDPGPVHLNARARKPLEPPAESASSELGSRVSALLARPSLRVDEGDTAPAAPAVAALTRAIEGAERGVIVCGPEPLAAPVPAALVDLSEATGFPLLCEAPSQLRFDAAPEATPIDAFDWILRGPELEARLVPDLALRFGAPPTSPGLERLLGAAGAYHVITPHGFADAQAGAQSVTFGSSARVAAALVARLTARPRSTAFREDWSARNRSAWAAVEATLESDDAFHEGSAVRAAVEVLPHGGLLALGNSLPVREVDQYVPAGARGLRVACQRGANGIDGVVSATAGAALDFPGPSLLLVGDVSFLHDLGGLDLVRRAERALVILVLDNGGGRIFDQLPIGDHYRRRPELARFWQTPPAADLSHAAALVRIPFREVESQAALTQALHAALERGGPSVVVARVAPESARLDVEAVSHALSSPQAR